MPFYVSRSTSPPVTNLQARTASRVTYKMPPSKSFVNERRKSAGMRSKKKREGGGKEKMRKRKEKACEKYEDPYAPHRNFAACTAPLGDNLPGFHPGNAGTYERANYPCGGIDDGDYGYARANNIGQPFPHPTPSCIGPNPAASCIRPNPAASCIRPSPAASFIGPERSGWPGPGPGYGPSYGGTDIRYNGPYSRPFPQNPSFAYGSGPGSTALNENPLRSSSYAAGYGLNSSYGNRYGLPQGRGGIDGRFPNPGYGNLGGPNGSFAGFPGGGYRGYGGYGGYIGDDFRSNIPCPVHGYYNRYEEQ